MRLGAGRTGRSSTDRDVTHVTDWI